MAKKRRNDISIDNKQIIAIAILVLSLIIYFHLFFIGGILFNIINSFIGNPYLLLFIIDAYVILIMLKLEKTLTIFEIIGVLLVYFSLSIIMDKSILFISLAKIFSVIITQNLAQVVYFFTFVCGVILCLTRFKNIIFRELNIKIKETNSTILNYKEKIEQKKELKFEQLSKNDLKTYNYITTYLEQKKEPNTPLIKNISKNYVSEYANSIYQYIDDIKTALIKIHALNEQEIIFTNEDITIEQIKITYYTKDLVNKKIICGKIAEVIKNSSLKVEGNFWTLSLRYQTNILVSAKDLITNYVDYNTFSLGVSNLGKFANIAKNQNIFINYENITIMNKFIENVYYQKSLNNEKFIIIDYNKQILTNCINKENVLYEVINNSKNLFSLLKYIESDINEKQNYINDLGYNSYLNYVKHKNLNNEITNIVFHEISTISLVENNKLYDKILKLSKKGNEYGYNFIFTNSKENKEIINSQIYTQTPIKLFFETYSNSFSKLLIKSKLLKSLSNKYAFYIQRNDKFQKVYFPGNDLQAEYIYNLIGESLHKNKLQQALLNNMWILEELKEKKLKNQVITTTFVMTKYKIDIQQAQQIVEKLNKMR